MITRLCCISTLLVLLSFSFKTMHAQSVAAPQVIKTLKKYKNYTTRFPGDLLVPAAHLIPALQTDFPYATTRNFTGQILYSETPVLFLTREATDSLGKVVAHLEKLGYGLKVWDGYRPYHASVKMWHIVQDENYVANPAKGSGHNRGIAIDLTLTDLRTGRELNMGTAFDHFSDTAHTSFTALPPEVVQNRKILIETMEKYGFRSLKTEWWHFYLPDKNSIPLFNLSFRQLQNYYFAISQKNKQD